jgi:hypothetical protein
MRRALTVSLASHSGVGIERAETSSVIYF